MIRPCVSRGRFRFALQAGRTHPYIPRGMRRLFRTTLALFLTATLVFTASSMAAARAAPGPAGQMVLCIGLQSVTVYVDEDGAPVTAPHICPDCVLALLAAVLPPDMAAASQYAAEISHAWPDSNPRGALWWVRPQARGPPVL